MDLGPPTASCRLGCHCVVGGLVDIRRREAQETTRKMALGLLGYLFGVTCVKMRTEHAVTDVVGLSFCEPAPGAWLYFFVAGRLDAGLAFPRAWRTLAS